MHCEPHFDRDGDCQCFCAECSKEISRTSKVVECSCICPDCQHNGLITVAQGNRRAKIT